MWRLPKPCVPRGQRTSGGADVGALPARAIPRARAPLCAEGRLWVLSPGEPYPGREPLCVPRGGCGCFPRASHTPGESPFVCRGAVVGAFPGRAIPRVRALCVPRGGCGCFPRARHTPARVPFRPHHILCVLN